MGQYWHPVNLDKREYIHPHKMDSGLKLWEIMENNTVGRALVILTADMPESRGGGDLAADPIIGRWAGDRIAIVGDYAAKEDRCGWLDGETVYSLCDDVEGGFTDISEAVMAVIDREMDA